MRQQAGALRPRPYVVCLAGKRRVDHSHRRLDPLPSARFVKPVADGGLHNEGQQERRVGPGFDERGVPQHGHGGVKSQRIAHGGP